MVPQLGEVLKAMLVITTTALCVAMGLAVIYIAAKSANKHPDERPILREEGDKLPSLVRLMALDVILDERLDATDHFFAGDPTA